MERGSYEYSLGELVEHPVIRLMMEKEGFDRRSLGFMFGSKSRDLRDLPSWREEPVNT